MVLSIVDVGSLMDFFWGECSAMKFVFFENLSGFGWVDRIIPSTMKLFQLPGFAAFGRTKTLPLLGSG